MRYFRRLPPLLRVASLLSLLLPLGFFVLPLNGFVHMMSLSRTALLYGDLLVGIGLNLSMVGAACFVVVQSYTKRFREPGAPGPFPFDSWQSQMRAILLMAALPICALLLAVIIPLTSEASIIVLQVTGLGVFVLVAAGTNILHRHTII
jgi:hypothetical protein